ncbi:MULTISPECIES: AbrB/MazE/SpoVT family DNA-binding domain-containing protein [unclassified Caballeronia]|uniref:AbrB/MazE/SpoVT family DNA-binding domain-containing protein n=1 Tax=unclassified Caballeronia TaxID=2646786 RepID=UPI00286C4BFD|nr:MULTISPECIES: AbrB/MazE/SpoVT family DNA-binding domain-containing protein [unclassified Caballeronia]
MRLPAALLEQARVTIGDRLVVEIRSEGIVLAPARPRYSLDQLIARCDSKAPVSDDLVNWISIKDAGRKTSCSRLSLRRTPYFPIISRNHLG